MTYEKTKSFLEKKNRKYLTAKLKIISY